MSTFELTYDVWNTLDVDDKRVLEALPKYKAMVLEFKKQDAQEDIEFSKQAYFELPDGSVVSLAVLEMVLYSQLGGRETDLTKYGVLKTAGWSLKDRIKAGFEASGTQYHFGIKELKALAVEQLQAATKQ